MEETVHPTSTTKKESEEESKEKNYAGIAKMAGWIQENIGIQPKDLELLESSVLVQTIADRTGDALPIRSSFGVATIPDQIGFWEQNRELFDIALKNRQRARNLTFEREEMIIPLRELKKDLTQVQTDMASLSESPEDVQDRDEWTLKLKQAETELTGEITELQTELDKTKDENRDNHNRRNQITSNIDCKLPTVITGQVLCNMGFEVSLICFDDPLHPTLIASRLEHDGTENVFMIGFSGTPNEFRSEPYIRQFRSDRYVSAASHFARNSNFTSDQEPWPLPFNETSFAKFDDWFTTHKTTN